jgi:hypothetical protein
MDSESARGVPLSGGRAVARPRSRRSGARRWHRLRRRAQVSAVATILGLLLVVTFIASYLTTTLPNEMAVNDLAHDTLVQNQVGTIAALLPPFASSGEFDAALYLPVSLGSQSEPPFAGQDSSVLGAQITGFNGTSPHNQYSSNLSVSYGLIAGTVHTQIYVSNTANLLVNLRNTYASPVEVAYEQGAVIIAQPAGYPTIVDPPDLSYASGVLSLWEPNFVVPSAVASEAGISTALVGLRLISGSSLTFPGSGWSLNASVPVKLVYHTPFAYAWMNYFCGISSIEPFANISWNNAFVGCGGSYARAFQPAGLIGTVALTLPVTKMTLSRAVFDVSLQ